MKRAASERVIESAKVPVAPAARAAFGDRALAMALSGGEDYELVFTAPPSVMETSRRAWTAP